jgi:hypothetical protein
MKNELGEICKNWDEFFESEKGKADLEEYANQFVKKKQIEDARIERVKVYVEKHGIFAVMERLINEHDETWREHCYLKNYEPYENNKLDLFLAFIMKYGKSTKKHTNKIFNNHTWKYEDFYFNLMHGQGSVWSIFYKNENIY